ncbi:hypothetical protein F2P45_04600 [Massilia sp. CCM 8733]|uniref:Uncharacterized protein n=1 Tax=Massilia mucilaginosa TaxID=2609282 RepID=A0ABX0NND4_9BURK|nr:hypothetical protein [Massilia mucilaginosa]
MFAQDGQRSGQQLLTNLAQGENLSIRQLYLRIASGRGRWLQHHAAIACAGTPADCIAPARA